LREINFWSYYFFEEEEIKTPYFIRGFFIYKKRLPFSGEPYRSSKPIAGILRRKSQEEHKCSMTYTVM